MPVNGAAVELVKRGMPVSLCVLLLALAPLWAGAQDTSLSGTWSVKGEAAEGRTADGGSYQRGAISGTLVIEQNRSELRGTWTGPQGEPWPLTGAWRDGRFELRSEAREVAIIRNGERVVQPMRWRFTGTVTSEKLAGEMALEPADREGAPPQPFTAERRRG